MEYGCNLLLQYIIYKNDIINHYGEGEWLCRSPNTVVLRTALLIVSKFNSPPPPVCFFLLLVSFIAVQCLFISGFVNEVFATKVIEISPRDPQG